MKSILLFPLILILLSCEVDLKKVKAVTAQKETQTEKENQSSTLCCEKPNN